MIARQLPARTLPLQEWRIVLSPIETERFVHVMGRPEGFFSATHIVWHERRVCDSSGSLAS